jgi:hypothetical protein
VHNGRMHAKYLAGLHFAPRYGVRRPAHGVSCIVPAVFMCVGWPLKRDVACRLRPNGSAALQVGGLAVLWWWPKPYRPAMLPQQTWSNLWSQGTMPTVEVRFLTPSR